MVVTRAGTSTDFTYNQRLEDYENRKMVVTRAGTSTDFTYNQRLEDYESRTLARYKSHLKEYEGRSFCAAKMNYAEAADNDKWSFRFKLWSSIVASGATSFGVTQVEWAYNNLGYGILVVFVIVFLAMYWALGAFPVYGARAKKHNEAAGMWQFLQEKMYCYRWTLDHPDTVVDKVPQKFIRLMKERGKIVNIVDIPQATYMKYEDPEYIKNLMQKAKNRRQVFLED